MGNPSSDLRDIITKFKPDLAHFEKVYKDLHQHPELSHQEQRTSSIAAQHLKSLDAFEVIENIGGHGLVGILRNGAGPTVLLRADMDALPVKETTGLEYASTKIAEDSEGRQVPVMAACKLTLVHDDALAESTNRRA